MLSDIFKNKKKKGKFRLGVALWRGSSLQLAPMQTEQYCNYDRSIAICVNLTDSETKYNLPRDAPEGKKTLPLSHLAQDSRSCTFKKQLLYKT